MWRTQHAPQASPQARPSLNNARTADLAAVSPPRRPLNANLSLLHQPTPCPDMAIFGSFEHGEKIHLSALFPTSVEP